jgi:hypothetical protein
MVFRELTVYSRVDVLRGLTFYSRVDGIYRVYSVLTCGWYLESLQFTHVWMVFREFTAYSRVGGI